MPVPSTDTVTEHAAVEVITRLRRFGFRVEQVLDEFSELDALYLARHWQGVRDVVLVYSPQEALAYRSTAAFDPEHPFHLDLEATVWRYGPATPGTVAEAVLGLRAARYPRTIRR